MTPPATVSTRAREELPYDIAAARADRFPTPIRAWRCVNDISRCSSQPRRAHGSSNGTY